MLFPYGPTGDYVDYVDHVAGPTGGRTTAPPPTPDCPARPRCRPPRPRARASTTSSADPRVDRRLPAPRQSRPAPARTAPGAPCSGPRGEFRRGRAGARSRGRSGAAVYPAAGPSRLDVGWPSGRPRGQGGVSGIPIGTAAVGLPAGVGVHPNVHSQVRINVHGLRSASSWWGRWGHPRRHGAGQDPPSRAPCGRRVAMGLRPTLDCGTRPGVGWLSDAPSAAASACCARSRVPG